MMLPSAGGDAWPGDAVGSASVAESYFAPIRVICVTSATALSLPAERRVRPQARPAGSPSRRTTTTSAGPCTWLATRPGERVIPAIGVSPHANAVRLNDVSTTQAIGSIGKTSIFVRSPLQDLLTAQPAVLIGLIAHLVGTPQQDDTRDVLQNLPL